MKLVIDISEARYKDIQRISDVQIKRNHFQTAEQIIANGIPLPETNAGDLISRQAVIDRINRLIEVEKKQGTDDWGYGRERVNAYEAMLHMVESEYLYPSVEPERKSGKWEYVQYDGNPKIGNWHCSECRLIVNLGFEGAPYYDYCPGCGAKMEVEE